MNLVIHGAPRTKKNSQRIVRAGRRPVLLQSREYLAWEDAAVPQLRAQLRCAGILHYTAPVNMRALVYRDRNVGDLGNYLAAACDVLERAGVVVNDRLIGGFDGSRLLVDKQRPRVEIELTPLELTPP